MGLTVCESVNDLSFLKLDLSIIESKHWEKTFPIALSSRTVLAIQFQSPVYVKIVKFTISCGSTLNLRPKIRPVCTARGSPSLSLQIRQVPELWSKCEFLGLVGWAVGQRLALYLFTYLFMENEVVPWRCIAPDQCSQFKGPLVLPRPLLWAEEWIISWKEQRCILTQALQSQTGGLIDLIITSPAVDQMNVGGTFQLGKPLDASFLWEQVDWTTFLLWITFYFLRSSMLEDISSLFQVTLYCCSVFKLFVRLFVLLMLTWAPLN